MWNDDGLNCDYPYKVTYYCQPKQAVPYVVSIDNILNKELPVIKSHDPNATPDEPDRENNLLTYYQQ